MVAHNDERLKAGAGYPDHPHSDLEIVTWVLTGRLRHADSAGGTGTVEPGTVQVVSAGSGIVHSETADADAGPTRFVQVWLRPDEPGLEPRYATAPAAEAVAAGGLVPVVSGHRDDALLRVGTSAATFWVASLGPGDTVTLPDEPIVHVFVGRGALVRSSLAEPLADGDAFRITDRPGLEVTAAVPTELLVWSFRA